jgi:N-acetylneuraminic acid mutarotase
MNTLIARTLTLLFFAVIVPANADTWEQRFPTGTPPAARAFHTAVWTGSEMIVWGGARNPAGANSLNDGGRYNPMTNTWTAMSTIGAPAPRNRHTAVWTGTEMIVWGGNPDTGFISLNSGGRYNPATNSWAALPLTDAPAARAFHTAVWTNTEMIVWGGAGGGVALNSGGRYNPLTNSWGAVSTTGAPAARSAHTAVWTGAEMFVWGGHAVGGGLNTGGRYNPASQSWIAVTMAEPPAARSSHTAIWTGTEMIVWGGDDSTGTNSTLNNGGRYSPSGNSWTAVTTTGAPPARAFHAAVWTGSEIIVWGGNYSFLNDGGRYSPAGNSWTALTTVGAPAGRSYHTAVWTGSEMIVWGGWKGGFSDTDFFNDTFSYTPNDKGFRITSAVLEGGNLLVSFPSVTGRSYTLWQSDSMNEGTWTDTGLPVQGGTGETLTFTIAAPVPGRRFFRVQGTP